MARMRSASWARATSAGSDADAEVADVEIVERAVVTAPGGGSRRWSGRSLAWRNVAMSARPPLVQPPPPRMASGLRRAREQRHHAGERRRVGVRRGDRGAADIGDLDLALLHFLGERDRPPGRGGRWWRHRRRGRRVRGCGRRRRSGSPISPAAGTCGGSRLPGSSRGRSRRRGSGRRTAAAACESWKAMCTPMAAWQAPGPRVTNAAAGRPVSLP